MSRLLRGASTPESAATAIHPFWDASTRSQHIFFAQRLGETMTAEYDAAGRTSALTFVAGERVNYACDLAGRSTGQQAPWAISPTHGLRRSR